MREDLYWSLVGNCFFPVVFNLGFYFSLHDFLSWVFASISCDILSDSPRDSVQFIEWSPKSCPRALLIANIHGRITIWSQPSQVGISTMNILFSLSSKLFLFNFRLCLVISFLGSR